jgi:S1-C subfamily serine protease
MRRNRKVAAKMFAAIACLLSPTAMRAASDGPADDANLSAAICQLVYPVDQSASERGVHYLFYGNGFFINAQGYFITAAHVLSQLHGGQPYLLLRQIAGPPRIVPAALVALDRDHDVAVLRVTPNPFDGKFKVGFLPLAENWLVRGRAVLAAAEHPSKPLDAYTLDATVEDRSSGEVSDFQFSQLGKGPSDTELFLFNHQVRRGQSGAPIVSGDSHEVVGLVEGQWLRSSLISLAAAPDQGTPGIGAAIPIHYAIALLQQRGIAWHTVSRSLENFDGPPGHATDSSAPIPLSLVAAPYPSHAILGGEVVLDALIDSRGRLVDIKAVRGESPFLEKVISAVRTWTFLPAHVEGHAIAARIGITFQFSQTYERLPSALVHKYDEPLANSAERGALPVLTVEPQYPATSAADGGVILYALVGREGDLTSVQVIRDAQPLTAAAVAAVDEWRFVPGKRAGADTESASIVVVIFRHSGSAQTSAGKK